MNPFEWAQVWDGNEIRLYIGKDAAGQEKIFTRVAKIEETEPEDQREVIYEREICLLNPEIIRGLDREKWVEKQLRWFIDTYPDFFEREKEYLKDFTKRGL